MGWIKQEEEQVDDTVNHPEHYLTGGIETIDFIKAKLGREGFVAYCMGNVIKYTSRWGFKNGVKDLEKAQVYLNWSIQEMQDEAIRKQENGES